MGRAARREQVAALVAPQLTEHEELLGTGLVAVMVWLYWRRRAAA